jgi:hypothetical protein
MLGPGWLGPQGLIIDDVGDLSSLSGSEKRVAEELVRALAPAGVQACADFSYTRRDQPAIVTLRVFVFQDVAKAASWWKSKYGSPEARGASKEVAGLGDEALDLDNEFQRKRVVRSGAVVLSCHQLEKGSEHIQVLDRYLAKVSRS